MQLLYIEIAKYSMRKQVRQFSKLAQATTELWLTVTGEGERLSEELAVHGDFDADAQALLELILRHAGAPHEARVLGEIVAGVRRTQTAEKRRKNAKLIKTSVTLRSNHYT